LTQIDHPLAARGLARHYRIGIAARGYEDASTVLRVEAFDGAGLRPYPVSHLRGNVDLAGNVLLDWKRRTRIDGDTWQAIEVPLGEDFEAYVLRIMQGEDIKAEYSSNQPQFTYSQAMQAADGVTGPFRVEVAQLSARYGPGPFRSISLAS
jgi:hypothetical protein